MSDESGVPDLVDSSVEHVRPDDSMSATDGKHRIIDEAMSLYIESTLQEEGEEYDNVILSNHVANEIILTEEEANRLNEEAERSYMEAEKASQEEQARKEAQKAMMEDDGFQVVGKKGKAKGPKVQKIPGSSKDSKQPPSQTQFHIGYAAEAEIRPKMAGDKKYPFCFVCSCRHDFDQCGTNATTKMIDNDEEE